MGSISKDDNDPNVVERAIAHMENGICKHPTHGHSFVVLPFSWQKCSVCQTRLLLQQQAAAVRCVACGVTAHRSCSTACAPCSVNNIDDDGHEETANDEHGDEIIVWTEQGPPSHWAVTPDGATVNFTKQQEQERPPSADKQQSFSLANISSASISQALQENISRHFQNRQEHQTIAPEESLTDNHDEDEQLLLNKQQEQQQQTDPSNTSLTLTPSAVNLGKLGIAAVAGGIAGGMAGLVLAGPAGAYCGYQVGRAAGALGVLVESGVTVGVFVAGVATGGVAAQQIMEQHLIHQERILTMGEAGASQKVLLVRPNIRIDPVWNQITIQARKTVPSTGFSLLPFGRGNDRVKDEDIIQTAEDELSTHDKVFLLVNRILNDKNTLPGHVFRYLVDEFFHRCQERLELVQNNESVQAVSPRARRDDTHAVIKHVTACLLEVRPGLGASPTLTEWTATVVESLVFGQLYDMVMEEICTETADRDEALMLRSVALPSSDDGNGHDKTVLCIPFVLHDAVEALHKLPKARTPVDKLFYCVAFLEAIACQDINADTLLTIVCQHVVAARVPNMHAEIAFLEEFARDDCLLRGREGYALVTLQASLHFLNQDEEQAQEDKEGQSRHILNL